MDETIGLNGKKLGTKGVELGRTGSGASVQIWIDGGEEGVWKRRERTVYIVSGGDMIMK